MIHGIRRWWGTTRRHEEGDGAQQPSAAAGQGTERPPRRRHAVHAPVALRQIEAEAPLLPPAAVMPSKFAATTIMWAHNEIDRCGDEADKLLKRAADLDGQRAECRVLAGQLLDRRRDVAAWLRMTQFPVPPMSKPSTELDRESAAPEPATDQPPEPVFTPSGPLHEPTSPPQSDPATVILGPGETRTSWWERASGDVPEDLGDTLADLQALDGVR